MVLPPNRVGGVRGPDGRTITDLYNLLESFNQPGSIFYTLYLQLATIQQTLDYLIGTNDGVPPVVQGWQGLPRYLSQYVSPLGLTNFPPQDIRGQLALSRSELEAIRRGLFADEAAGIEWLQLIAEATSNTAGALAGGPTTTNGLLAAIKATLGDSGLGITVYEFLEQVAANTLRTAECCEEGQGGGTLPPLPPDVCIAPEDAVRVVAWNRLQTSAPGAVTSYNTWAADFGSLATLGLSRQTDANGAVYYTYPAGGPLGATADLCAAWDFRGDVQTGIQRFGSQNDPMTLASPGLPQAAQLGSTTISVTAPTGSAPTPQVRFTRDYNGEASEAPPLAAWIGPSSVG